MGFFGSYFYSQIGIVLANEEVIVCLFVAEEVLLTLVVDRTFFVLDFLGEVDCGCLWLTRLDCLHIFLCLGFL